MIAFGLPLLIMGTIFCIPPKPANAAYDGSNLIDNAIFLNTNSMDIPTIQNFLASKGSGLAGRSFYLSCPQGSQEQQWYAAVGAPCNQNVPASYIIFYTAKVYGLNPQVILATMQKEQSLITAPNPTARQVAQAMGYGCPTTGNCDDSSNFFWQVDNGTWALRYHYERANRNFNWWRPSSTWVCGTEKEFYKPNLYPGQNVQFFDENGTYYRTHFIVNAATSALYCYTPHAYNNPQGLYGRTPYGTTGLYYSGSYNFVYFFELWFGSTNANCTFPESVTNGVYRLYNRGTGNHLLTSSPAEVCEATRAGYLYDGQMFMSESSQGVPVFRLERGGRYLFTASTAERDAAIAQNGFRLEGVAFDAVNPSINPSEARPVYRLSSLAGTYVYTISDYERDNLASYGYRYEGVSFYLKENPGTAVASTYRLAHPQGMYLFTLSTTERDSASQSYGYRYEGVGWNGITQMNAITTPVYRLAGKNGYVLTTNLLERIAATQIGYRNEGVGMYTYGTMNDPNLKKTYRLASKSGSYLYTTSETERDVAIQQYGYRLEGIGFLTP